MATLNRILQPAVLTEVVSQQMAAEHWLLQLFGVQPGGPNERDYGHGREGKYRVFDNTRKVGTISAPGTPANFTGPQVVKEVPFVYPRMHEKIPLLAEELHNLSRIESQSERDVAGENMVTLQTRYLAQKAGNFRAVMLAGMFRDALYEHVSGQDRYWNFTSSGALKRVNFQMPSGNQSQLNMLGGGDIIDTSWDNSSANIPKHLSSIDAAFEQLYGGRLETMIVTGTGWQNIINNDFVASQAGIAGPPFRTFERVVGVREDGSPLQVSVGEISARPGLMIYITDSGLQLGAPGSETFTKYVGDSNALFLGRPDGGNYTMHLGSEPIAEYNGGPKSVRRGFSSWAVETADPTATMLYSLDNALMVNHIPNSLAYGTVVF